MRQIPAVLSLFVILLMPVYASAQSPDRITLLDTFGSFKQGEPLFVFGQVAKMSEDSFLIMQIINPEGDLCQIQQLVPLSNGMFITDIIPLKGRICGLVGEYEIKIFYGDYAKSASFLVSPGPYSETASDEKIALAKGLVDAHSLAIASNFDIPPPIPENFTSNSLPELESLYVDMWGDYYDDSLIVEIDPLFRPAVSSSLDSVKQLLDDGKISYDIAKSIDDMTFASAFYYGIGDKTNAIDLLTDAFVDIRNVNPEKQTAKKTPSFDDLEETLLNLMKKSNTVMSKPVKNEIGHIFARGTAPVYSDEITELVDVLSKSRYLDVVSRKQSDLYRMVQNDWNTLKPSLSEKQSIEDLIESKSRVSELHQASILLRELDSVERFISSGSEDGDGDLVGLLIPAWDSLSSDLALATSVGDILESEPEIYQMSQMADISSRISKIVEISRSSGMDPAIVGDWELLLERVKDATSAAEILEIVSEFDNSMTELREKRNPLVLLEFQYRSMKEKAELQADDENLFLINNALRILDTARQMESGNPSITRIDRIEVLLTWVSEKAPAIKTDLDSYNKDAFKVKAGEILQKTKSLENLVELSMTKNRFLPNYVEFAENFNEKIDNIRSLVVANYLEEADMQVRDLFEEWTLVSAAYTDDPFGSDGGYSLDELKRIEFRKKLDAFSNMVSTFYNSRFAAHADEYEKMMDEANELIEIANFVDAESKVTEIGNYLSKYLVLRDPGILYDISFDQERDLWIISGATEKSLFDRRENLYVTVYAMDGTAHSTLEFTDTKEGNFFTQWVAPTEPGLYVVMLQYKDAKATQIVHIEEEFGYEYSKADLDMVDLSRQFNELESFAEEFGGNAFETNPRFASVINEIKSGLRDDNAESVDENIDELKTIIERYLPVRSRTAVVEAQYDNDQLILSGAVQKSFAFREDLYVDVYDQQGNLVDEISLKDNSSGLFTEVMSHPFDSGIYVVRLQYHDVAVTDFFNVR